MQKQKILEIIDSIKSDQISKEEAFKLLSNINYEELGFAKLDHHREIRTGVPEVVFCQGKTDQQIVSIINKLREQSSCIIGTRLSEDAYLRIKDSIPDATYHNLARVIVSGTPNPISNSLSDKYIAVMCAGTADLPVAEEAAVIAQTLGSPVKKACDVGVAGIHRLLDNREIIEKANVIIVCAGMEGALPSVIGGLASRPVIAVPTSVGYGASFNGLSALLAMLNSCASGISVVNIDNGFGAGFLAHMINKTNLDI